MARRMGARRSSFGGYRRFWKQERGACDRRVNSDRGFSTKINCESKMDIVGKGGAMCSGEEKERGFSAKAILRSAIALALAIISSPVSHAYEKDIHFSATLAIAIADGWSVEEALVIASADQGMDENKSTIAALEIDVIGSQFTTRNRSNYYVRGPIHQAKKNFHFHCFNNTKDEGNKIQRYVHLMADMQHRAATDAMDIDAKANSAQLSWTRSLIATGVALHCVQDSYSHNGYGGSCRITPTKSYEGSCYGHAKDSGKDVFANFFNDRTNPDHPAVREKKDLLSAFTATQAILQSLWERRNGYAQPARRRTGVSTPQEDLDRLAEWLHNPSTKMLSDDERIACNHEVTARWLFEVLQSRGLADSVVQNRALPTQTCASVFPEQLSKARVLFPLPKYPNLDWQARHSGANPYAVVDQKDMADLKVEEISHKQHSCTDTECTYSFKVLISNKEQAYSAAGYLLLTVIPIDDDREGFGIKVVFDKMARASVVLSAATLAPREVSYFIYAVLQPSSDTSEWIDKNLKNDSAYCLVTDGNVPIRITPENQASCRGLDDG